MVRVVSRRVLACSLLLVLGTTSLAQAEDCYGTHTLGGCFAVLEPSGPAEAGPFRSLSIGRALPFGSVATSMNAWHLVRPAELVVSSQDPNGRTVDVVSRATALDFRAAIGIGRSLDLSLGVPVYVDIRGAGSDAIATQKPPPVSGSALGDIRLGLRSSLLSNSAFRLMLRNDWTLPSGNQSKYAGDVGTTSSLALTLAWQQSGWSAVLDAGYRAAPAVRFGDVRLGSQALFGLGFARDILEPGILSIGLEAHMNPVLVYAPTTDMPEVPGVHPVISRTHAVPAEWMANVQFHPHNSPFWAWLGGGSALPVSSRDVVAGASFADSHFVAPATPRIRIGLGWGWQFDFAQQ